MKDHFTNSKGIEVYCLAISSDYVQDMISNVEKDFEREFGPLVVPVRKVPAAGGSVIEEPLSTIEESEWTAGEKAEVTAYLEKRGILDQRTNDATLIMLCLEGIKLDTDTYPDTWGVPTRWVSRQLTVFKNPVPVDDEDMLKLQYCRSQLIVTRSNEPDSDLSQASFTCTALAYTGLTAEAEEALRESFLNSMGGTNGRPANSSVGDQTEGTEFQEPGTILVIQPEVLGGGDSHSLHGDVAREIQGGSTGVAGRSDDVGEIQGGDGEIRTSSGKRKASGA